MRFHAYQALGNDDLVVEPGGVGPTAEGAGPGCDRRLGVGGDGLLVEGATPGGRGAGSTLASGSSACAVAAASVRPGSCDGSVTVVMPGGELEIGVGAGFAPTMLGPVRKMAEGTAAEELLREVLARAGPRPTGVP